MRTAFGDFVIDVEAFELSQAGEPIPVEPQVFEVLSHLVANRERVVSRQELLDAVWGTSFITDGALATRIKEARRAVGDDGRAQQVIRTVHGRGYRFVAETDEVAVPTSPAVETVRAATAPSRLPVAGGARSDERLRLEEEFAAAAQGTRRVIFVSGDAGIGKSTLIGAFERSLGDEVIAGRGQCLEQRGGGEAYMPLLESLSRMARSGDGDAIVTSLRQTAPTWVAQLPWLTTEADADTQALAGATPERMLRELAEALESVAQTQTVVLVLEDLHWADPSTIDALQMLARRPEDARLLILATIRTGDATSQDHTIHTAARDLIARGYASELPLVALGDGDFRRLIEERVPGASDSSELVSLLMDRTSGNPLFATSLLDELLAVGQLEQQDGAWSLNTAADAPAAIPESIRQLVENQLTRLEESDHEILEAAAVLGAPVTAEAIAAIVESDADAIDRRLTSLGRGRLFLARAGLHQWPDGAVEDRYEFGHSLYREILADRISTGRRMRMHRAAGASLEERYGAEAEAYADDLARHYFLGRDAERAIPMLIVAAERALMRSAYREGRASVEAALTLLDGISSEAERDRYETTLQSMRGSAVIALEGWASPELEQSYARALELSGASGDYELIGDILYGLAAAYEYRGDFDMTQELLYERFPGRLESTAYQSLYHELLACSLFHQGSFQEAFEHAEAGIIGDSYEGQATLRGYYGDLPPTACRTWSALSLWFLGLVDSSVTRTDEAVAAATDDPTKLHVHAHATMIFQFRGELDRLREHADVVLDVSGRLGLPFHGLMVQMLKWWADAIDGDAGAVDRLRGGTDQYHATGIRLDLPYYLGLLGDVYRRFERFDEALEVLDEGLAMIQPQRGRMFEAELRRVRALTVLDQSDDLDGAIAGFETGLRVAREQGAKALEVRMLTTMAERTGGETAERARLELAELLESLEEGDGSPDWVAARRVTDTVAATS